MPATEAEVSEWCRVKAKFSAAPYNVDMNPVYGHVSVKDGHLCDDDIMLLNDQLLEVSESPTSSIMTPAYVLEPYWSDIVTVLETEDICHMPRTMGSVVKHGQPAKYYWTPDPDCELLGTSDTHKAMFDFRPCRSLTRPGNKVDKVRKCSRCKQAAYWSQDCQEAHWDLHKHNCKAANLSVRSA